MGCGILGFERSALLPPDQLDSKNQGTDHIPTNCFGDLGKNLLPLTFNEFHLEAIQCGF